jgi:hypothetical protein
LKSTAGRHNLFKFYQKSGEDEEGDVSEVAGVVDEAVERAVVAEVVVSEQLKLELKYLFQNKLNSSRLRLKLSFTFPPKGQGCCIYCVYT